MTKNYAEDVWRTKIAFYLDAVSFYFKTNPLDQARTPKGGIWRCKDEGLARYCTVKGDHVGSGEKVLKLIVAISYGEGVILCQEYNKMDGQFFEQFILNNFVQMMHDSNKDTTLFIEEGDPSQNSAKARKALNTVGATLLKIPPRSPDINPIENLFNIVKRKLREQAIREQITQETFKAFANCVKTLICNVSISSIDNLIASMPKRMLLIIKSKGNHTKY